MNEQVTVLETKDEFKVVGPENETVAVIEKSWWSPKADTSRSPVGTRIERTRIHRDTAQRIADMLNEGEHEVSKPQLLVELSKTLSFELTPEQAKQAEDDPMNLAEELAGDEITNELGIICAELIED